jgi:hypothetical protein
MPQLRGCIRLAQEPLSVAGIRGCLGAEYLQCVATRQAGMLGEINLAHTARAEPSNDRKASKLLAQP